MFACFGFAGESSRTALKPSLSTQANTKWYTRSWNSEKAARTARAAGLPQPVAEGAIHASAGAVDPAAVYPHLSQQLSERHLKKARKAEKARERREEKAAFQANTSNVLTAHRKSAGASGSSSAAVV